MRSPADRPTLLLLLLLAGCSETTVPFQVEHVGTLPPARYAVFDQLAAGVPPRLKVYGNNSKAAPEPYWIFAFDAPFDPRAAPLQIGSFSGATKTAQRVAGNLPAQLQQTLEAAHLFPAVTMSPVPHAFVLSGTVTRADDDGSSIAAESDAATQVEASVTRDGAVLGAIQINAIQMDVAPLSLLTSLIMSLAQGSRASFVSDKFGEVFAKAASGARSGIGTDSLSARFLRVPEDGISPVPAAQDQRAEATVAPVR